MKTVPYWRLSSFYFFYFAALGALLPYWGLYLKNLGFHPEAIGQLLAILTITKTIAPNIWGWIADRSGRHVFWVRLGSLLGAICFLGTLFTYNYWALMIILISYSFFWNAVLPQVEVITFDYLGKHAKRYTHIRLWGSVGFICAVIGLGYAFENISILWLPHLMLIIYVGIWLSSLMINEPSTTIHHHSQTISLKDILTHPVVIALFIVCFLIRFSHGTYYTFYTIYLEDNGYSRDMIGYLWSLGVIAEIVLFLYSHRLLARFDLSHLLTFTFVITGLRWVLIAYGVEFPIIIVLAQLFHAVSFGLYHATAIQFIHHYFPEGLKGRGQALYSSISFGAGGAMGHLVSGYTWEGLGPQSSFLISTLICLMTTWISWKWLHLHRSLQPSG